MVPILLFWKKKFISMENLNAQFYWLLHKMLHKTAWQILKAPSRKSKKFICV